MRAMVTMAHGDRGVLALRADYPDPAPAPDEAIVRVAATALNRQDIANRLGTPGVRLPLPLIAGSDIAGEVVGVGRAVRGWTAGDRVLVDPAFRDGRRIGLIGETADGGRAEYVVVPASQLLTVPEAVSLDDAAALPLAYGTAHRMLVRGKVRPGERVLVLGASGGVGVAAVQLAKVLGAEVVACAGKAWKLERLQAAGADYTIHTGHDPVDQRVANLFGAPRIGGGGGVDVAVNLVGGVTWRAAQRSVAAGGRLLTTATATDIEVAVDARRLWSFEQEVIGSHGWTETDLDALLGLVAVGRLDPMIDRILPLEETAEGERLLEEREVLGKVLIRP
jgi:alcohol dehydrogenase